VLEARRNQRTVDFVDREVSLRANGRYLDALAAVDNPTEAKRALQRVTTPKQDAAGRRCAGFNPLARGDVALFQSVIDGEHCLKGFTNRDIRAQLQTAPHLRACGRDHRKQSATVSRIFRRCHPRGVIAKIPHTRRRRVIGYGRQVMGASLYLHEHYFPNVYATIAA